MKKTGGLILIMVFAVVLFQGCEMMKGAKRDVINTGHHIGRGVNAMVELDKKMQEKYW